ncbi:MAG: hypothetical protein E6K76_02375 [Candidatus Eisenbacteria bacterium]|uniref:Outer membrane protein beta-barrel domain-containing protein n=1 Tax=Eiseniibacteriota bacterium TaxID=2212470 RepID=A0A538T979_UNCEI|nr:MAG: hypothetical protein E6K76_02375 [Candidatus Eisenbacteria bacterium]
MPQFPAAMSPETVEGLMQKLLVALTVLVFCSMASQNALARTNLGLRSLGGNVGLVDPENASSTLGLGVFANMGNLSPAIRLAPHLGYWSKSEDFGGAEASVHDFSLGTRCEYMFHVSSPKFQPYMGAGLGLHFLGAKASVPGFPTIKDSSTKLGLDMGGGFITPLSPKTDLVVDAWYGIVQDMNQFTMKVGVSFDLPNGSESRAPSRPSARHRPRR